MVRYSITVQTFSFPYPGFNFKISLITKINILIYIIPPYNSILDRFWYFLLSTDLAFVFCLYVLITFAWMKCSVVSVTSPRGQDQLCHHFLL